MNPPCDAAPARLLLIDPDPAALHWLAELLRSWGHQVSTAIEGSQMERALTLPTDLLLVDPCGRNDSGWQQLRRFRERSSLPIVALLSGAEVIDRVLALESGADAVMSKPVDPRELRARLRGLLSRAAAGNSSSGSLQFGRWRLDGATRRLQGPAGFSTLLSLAEYRVLRALLERPQSVLQRQELLDLARGAGVDALERSVDLLISRLRSKLDDDARRPRLIRTVRGIGYLFDDSQS